jgi:uncharacterized protein
LGHVDESDFGVAFESSAFETTTELIGEVALRIWMASTWDDLDIHAFLDVIDQQGRVQEVSRGWLKASRRRLDLQRSTPSRPFHAHTHIEPLTPGTDVQLDIEIWPVAFAIHPGERIRVRLAGRGPGTLSGWHRRSRGRNTLLFGGVRPSSILLPIAP